MPFWARLFLGLVCGPFVVLAYIGVGAWNAVSDLVSFISGDV